MTQPSTQRLVTEATLQSTLNGLVLSGQIATDPAINQWVTSPFTRANNDRTLGSNTATPMFIPATFGWTVSQCAINCTTAIASSTATVTVYADDGKMRPSTTVLATSPTISTATTGNKTATFATPFTVAAPGVWCAVSFSVTTVGISWAEVFGPGTSINTTLSNLLASSPLTVPENQNTALFYWVPRVALFRSA